MPAAADAPLKTNGRVFLPARKGIQHKNANVPLPDLLARRNHTFE